MAGNAYQIDKYVNIRMRAAKKLEQRRVLLISDDAVYLGKVKYVGNVLGHKPVIGRNHDASRGGNRIDGLEEGRGVGGKDADSAVAMLDEVVGQASSAVGELAVGAAQDTAVSSQVENGLGVGLDGGGAGEEKGWGKLVDVRRRRCYMGGLRS